MLKFDYLKNEKSFQSEIKTFFFVSQVLSFRHTKQTSKNLAEPLRLAVIFKDFMMALAVMNWSLYQHESQANQYSFLLILGK